jgi:hypothetical protein
VKREGSLSFLVGTISNVLVMEMGTDVGSGGYILVSCAHSNTTVVSFVFISQILTTGEHLDDKFGCINGRICLQPLNCSNFLDKTTLLSFTFCNSLNISAKSIIRLSFSYSVINKIFNYTKVV